MMRFHCCNQFNYCIIIPELNWICCYFGDDCFSVDLNLVLSVIGCPGVAGLELWRRPHGGGLGAVGLIAPQTVLLRWRVIKED